MKETQDKGRRRGAAGGGARVGGTRAGGPVGRRGGRPAPRMPAGFADLCRRARAVLHPRRLSGSAEAGGVGAALLAANGMVFTGVCIDTASSLGFCAEHAAAAAMVTAGESRVLRMVAVNWDGRILPPCGRCREFISQLHDDNLDTAVLVAEGVVVSLRDLLPFDWRTVAQGSLASPGEAS